MRPSGAEVARIRAVVRETAGPDAEVWLFGSRLDDRARGGDVDPMVRLPRPVARPAALAALLEAWPTRALGGRKVDVVLDAPNLARSGIHETVEDEGVRL